MVIRTVIATVQTSRDHKVSTKTIKSGTTPVRQQVPRLRKRGRFSRPGLNNGRAFIINRQARIERSPSRCQHNVQREKSKRAAKCG